MGEGGLLELHARAPHRPLHHSLAQRLCLLLPLPAPELPLPLQLLMVSLLSSQPFRGIDYHFEFSSERAPRIINFFRFLAF